MTDAFNKIQNFEKLRDIPPLTKWEDIETGEVYHIPPLIFYKRNDFVVIDKSDRHMTIRYITESFPSTMFKSDIVSNFIVKRWTKHHGKSNTK